MRTVYIDSDYKCHTVNDGTRKPMDTDFFDGKCDSFIEGYRLVPFGERWKRADGVVFHGEMIAPWKDFAQLDNAQRQFERERLADAEAALAILLGGEAA